MQRSARRCGCTRAQLSGITTTSMTTPTTTSAAAGRMASRMSKVPRLGHAARVLESIYLRLKNCADKYPSQQQHDGTLEGAGCL